VIVTSIVKRTTAKVVYYILYILIALIFILPVFYMFISSVKDDMRIVADMSTIKAFIPTLHPSWENYAEIVGKVKFFTFFKNSVVVAVINVALVTIINAMAGYVLLALVIALAIIPTESVIINRFMIVNKMHLLNSYIGLALPTAGYPMHIFLYYNHFKGMPQELIDAAIVDGESYNGIFWKIMLPLSKPIMATVAIMSFVRSWGDLLWPTLVTRDETYRTLPLALRALSTDVHIFWGQIFAFAALMTLPVLIVFIVFQKQFIESLTMTGIKG